MDGILSTQERYGALDQNKQAAIFLLTRPKEYSTLTKSKTIWNQPFNGPQKKEQWPKSKWEVLELTSSTATWFQTPSTEEVVKSYQLVEESSMQLSSLLNLDFSNLSSFAKSKHQTLSSEASIKSSAREEAWLSLKNQSKDSQLSF